MRLGVASFLFYVNYQLTCLLLTRRIHLRIPEDSFERVKSSGLFGSRSFDNNKFLGLWKETDRLWNKGFYHDAVRQRSEILSEIYEHHEIKSKDYFPPVFSIEFTSAFGHLGVLGACLEAESLRIIPPGKRTILRGSNSRDWHVFDCFSEKANISPFTNGGGWTEIPINWQMSERLQSIRGWDEFIDIYQVLESVYSKRTVNKAAPIFKLNQEYCDKSRGALVREGLLPTDWFVSLHVRSAGHPSLRRNQDIKTYLSAISFIVEQGGKVIRIGDPTMEKLVGQPGVIDLTNREDLKWTHTFVLGASEFHIGTTSGPTWIAPMFGVPTIQTNATSIARNTHTMSENSISVPKILARKGVNLSLNELLQHPQSYAEEELSSNSENLTYLNNTAEDILNATKETFLRVIEGRNIHSSVDASLNQIRRDCNAVGYGRISSTFLENNSHWFLRR